MRRTPALVLVCSAAAAAAPLEVSTGAHSVTTGDSYDWIHASGDATIDMTGGEATDGADVTADGETFANIGAGALGNSVFTISDGDIAKRAFSFENGTINLDGGTVNVARAYGFSTFNFSAGDVNFGVYANDDAVFNMSGGAAAGNAHGNHRSVFNLSGGSIAGDFFMQRNGDVVITADSFTYDHDNDDMTAPIPFELARGDEVVLTRDDPRFSDDLLNNIPQRVLYDFTPHFPDGSSTSFTFWGYGSGNLIWNGSLTLRLAGVSNPADLDNSGTVDSGDLAVLLAAWGGPDADLNDDGVTDSSDLAILLAAWD